MVAKRADIADLPNWPLYLSCDQAAAYLGVGATTFEREIKNGMWPEGIRRGPGGGRVVWYRPALEARAEQREGGSADDDSLEAYRARRNGAGTTASSASKARLRKGVDVHAAKLRDAATPKTVMGNARKPERINAAAAAALTGFGRCKLQHMAAQGRIPSAARLGAGVWSAICSLARRPPKVAAGVRNNTSSRRLHSASSKSDVATSDAGPNRHFLQNTGKF